jgi:protein-tyrosine-phosphatase
VDVPDPFYGDEAVFDACRDMVATACAALVASLTAHWASIDQS